MINCLMGPRESGKSTMARQIASAITAYSTRSVAILGVNGGMSIPVFKRWLIQQAPGAFVVIDQAGIAPQEAVELATWASVREASVLLIQTGPG